MLPEQFLKMTMYQLRSLINDSRPKAESRQAVGALKEAVQERKDDLASWMARRMTGA